MTFYVVDVDGLAVGVSGCCSNAETAPAQIAELEAIIASMQFEPEADLPPRWRPVG